MRVIPSGLTIRTEAASKVSVSAFPDSDAGHSGKARGRVARVLGPGTLDSVSGESGRTAAALEPVGQAVALRSRKARVRGAEVDRLPLSRLRDVLADFSVAWMSSNEKSTSFIHKVELQNATRSFHY